MPVDERSIELREYRVIIRQESMHRIIGYRVDAADMHAAELQGRVYAHKLGYVFVSVEEMDAAPPPLAVLDAYHRGVVMHDALTASELLKLPRVQAALARLRADRGNHGTKA